MPQHLDDRHDTHVARSERWAAAALKHRAAEKLALSKGNEARAAIARAAAEKAERHARENGQQVKRLAPLAPRARTARRLNESSAARRVSEAAALAATTPQPITNPTKEDRREAREAEKQRQRQEQAAAADGARRRKAGVDHDPRTAAAQREVVVGSRKSSEGRGADAVASFSDYASLIARRQDRTLPRIKAMEIFDELSHRAHAGLFPEPKFERGVDRSKSLPGVPDDRADSLREIQRLTARIGEEAAAILFHRVYQRMTFAWMAGQGMGEAERLGVLFLAAVDAVARFYGVAAPSKAVEIMEGQLAEH